MSRAVSDASITTPASKRSSGKRDETTSSEASSDDAEESFLIAASLTKGTKAKKAAKGELSSP
jgi:hypothetical protein